MSETKPMSNAAVLEHLSVQIESLRDEITTRLDQIEAKLDRHEDYFAHLSREVSQLKPVKSTPSKGTIRPGTYLHLILVSLVELGGEASVSRLMAKVQQKRGTTRRPLVVP